MTDTPAECQPHPTGYQMRLELYRSGEAKNWRWRLRHTNGHIIARYSQGGGHAGGYSRRIDALTVVANILGTSVPDWAGRTAPSDGLGYWFNLGTPSTSVPVHMVKR